MPFAMHGMSYKNMHASKYWRCTVLVCAPLDEALPMLELLRGRDVEQVVVVDAVARATATVKVFLANGRMRDRER